MKKSARGRTLRHLACVCTLAIAISAHGQSREFNVAPGDMKSALDAYIAQAGVQLLYKIDDIKGLSTKGVKATLPPEEALARLLEGTRLRVRRDASGAIAIYAVPPDKPEPHTEAVQDVVVTATRRREPVREVPMQVNVLKADALEREGSRDLADYVADQPGIDLAHSGPYAGALSIRGLTTGNQTVATVGVYIDDVATGSSAAYGTGASTPLDMGLLDLNHIEVLRGPQGTLYGAGAMGGVIKYVTNDPDTSEVYGHVRAGLTSTQGGGMGDTVSGMLNLPLKEDVAAVRIAAFRDLLGGYDDAVGPAGERRVNRGSNEGERVSALITPTRKLSIRLTVTAEQVRHNGNDLEDLNPATGQWVEGERRRLIYTPEPWHTNTTLLGMDIEYDFGWARLNSITSSQDVSLDAVLDASPTYVPILAGAGVPAQAVWAHSNGAQHRTSQEFRLTSRASHDVEWLAGLYINREHARTSGSLESTLPGISDFTLFTTNKPSTYRELAAYGDVTWHATPALALTGGLRVARNQQTYTNDSSGPLVGPTPALSGGDSSENSTTWLGTGTYALTPLSNVYVRAASGYRPGGPNGLQPNTSAAVSPMFKSDSLWSYEAGYKANLLDRTLSVEAAVYDIEWRNIQQPISDNGFSFITNAGDARIRGSELTLNWTPTPAWRVEAGLSAIDAKLRTDAIGLGAHAGDRLPFSARFSGSLGIDRHFDVDGHPAYVGATARYTGERQDGFPGSGVLPAYKLPAYMLFGLQGGVDFKRFNVSAYVRNLTNTRGLVTVSYSTLTAAQAVVTDPRVIGMSVDVPF